MNHLRAPASLPARLLALAIVLYALSFSYLTIVRFYAFEARALDMGNLNQAIWNTAHGQPFHFTNQPGAVNRLSLHVEPILLPIAALYRAYPGPPMLLALQATVVALGAWPLFALARHRLGSDWWALLFGLAFLLNPTIQAANWLEFHPVTLAPTFLIAAFYFLVTGRVSWFACFALLAAACKEEIALLILMMGLYAWAILRRPRLGLATMTLSLGWALTAVLVIQHWFADGNIHWARYGYLGDTPLQMVRTLLTRPDLIWAQLTQADALSYLGLLLLPVGFVALLAPEVLILALPSLGINLLADFPPMHQVTTLIYAAPIAPFVLMAAVIGARRAVTWVAWATASRPQGRRIRYVGLPLALLIGVSALFAHQQFGYLPGGGNFRLYTITDHHRRAAALIAHIPPDARVSAQDRLNPHVSGRETVYIFPRVDDADTIFLDVTGPAWPLHPADVRRAVDELLAGDFGVAAADDGYLLLRKGVAAQTMPASFYSAWRARMPVGSDAILAADGALELLDVRVATDSHGELVTQLVWRALKPIDRVLRFYIAYLDRTGAVIHDTEFYPPAVELWYPTSKWTPGEPVLVQTLPWALQAGAFTLAVAVEDALVGARLPLAPGNAELVLLEGDTLARLGHYQQTRPLGWVATPVTAIPSDPMVEAAFGNQVRLEGWRLSRTTVAPGELIHFALGWRTLQRPVFDYSVFVHLLDSNGVKVAQLDWQPHDEFGPRPMTTWRPGQTILDGQELLAPSELALGDYTLVLGVYDWRTGERLAVEGAGVRPEQAAEQVIQIEIIQVRR